MRGIPKRTCRICGRRIKPGYSAINNGSYHRRCLKRSSIGGDGPPADRERGCPVADIGIVAGESRCGGTVPWEAARIGWVLEPVVFALIVLALASFPPSGVPVHDAGGSVSFEPGASAPTFPPDATRGGGELFGD